MFSRNVTATKPLTRFRCLYQQCRTRCRQYGSATEDTFRERDVVLLRPENYFGEGKLCSLEAGLKATIKNARVSHDDVIGKRPRDIVKSDKRLTFRAVHPTLAEYVRLTPRICTPIYPADASIIVSYLDIHVSPRAPGSSDTSPMEILEAGTGHGALSLFLSRAIHAANPPRIPKPPGLDRGRSLLNTYPKETAKVDGNLDEEVHRERLEVYNQQVQEWKKSRCAVLHSVEDNRNRHQHAQRLISQFRGGMYADNIDFHLGDVSQWLQSRLDARDDDSRRFLSHAILDLPAAEDHIGAVCDALHIDGTLALFQPSITQILRSVESVKKQGLPLWLDSVVELTTGSSAGRPWTVKLVRPRPRNQDVSRDDRPESSDDTTVSSDLESESSVDGEVEEHSETETQALDAPNASPEVVSCRPTPGTVAVGGGFLALFKRKAPFHGADEVTS